FSSPHTGLSNVTGGSTSKRCGGNGRERKNMAHTRVSSQISEPMPIPTAMISSIAFMAPCIASQPTEDLRAKPKKPANRQRRSQRLWHVHVASKDLVQAGRHAPADARECGCPGDRAYQIERNVAPRRVSACAEQRRTDRSHAGH